jgi:ubiquinone/menaquinone biosynthesis C-methylase UbiE
VQKGNKRLQPNLIVKELCPPLVWRGLKVMKRNLKSWKSSHFSPESQDLSPYWEAKMAEILETWGEGNVWNEIQMFLLDAQGKVLDIACGTGKTMQTLEALNPKLELYGCDISDLLIEKAKARGLPSQRLLVCDATKMSAYADQSFDYAYTIGSLEHFTIDGIDKLLAETRRVVRKHCFHMMPTSRSGKDEGWLKTYQSFHNNSVDWWLGHFSKHFKNTRVFESAWNDDISVGKWFVTSRIN